MRIRPATLTDLSIVQATYEAGRAMQRAQQSVVWPLFSDDALVREIESGVLFCVVEAANVVGVFSMLRDDALIWGAAERGEHLYLHRIARTAAAQGRGLMQVILSWARQQCAAMGRVGLRMDTWASNDVLIAYYATEGFRAVGTRRMPADARLAAHYHGIELALLEATCEAAVPGLLSDGAG